MSQKVSSLQSLKKVLQQQKLYFITLLFALLYLYAGHMWAVDGLPPSMTHAQGGEPVTATVTAILTDTDAVRPNIAKFKHIRFTAQLTEGSEKGSTVTVSQNKAGTYYSNREVAVGDRVLVIKNIEHAGTWDYVEHQRSHILLGILVIFALCILWYAKAKGFNTLLSLFFCIAAIFTVFVPAILSGKNIYLWTFLTCTAIVSTNLLLVNGFHKKNLATALGCLCGILVAALTSMAADSFLHLTGIIDEESVYLLLLNKENPIDLRAIVFSAIIIGALGAIMDVAMDIASALYEMSQNEEMPTRHTLWQAGNNIGRDILGMMSNTLVLAYIGGSLTVVLLYAAYTYSFAALVNREMVVVEILQAIIGSFGILFTIPCTSFISSRLYAKRRRIRRRL